MMFFLNSADSLKKYGVDTQTVMSVIIPDTYTYFWNSTPSVLFQKMYDANKRFWTDERKEKATAHGLTPVQAYVLASIVEEESNNHAEQGNIASVYLNRMNKGMPLQADPTIKFALHNFGLKRIYEKYLLVESPYNTYKNKGLPPGPICTPSKKTLEAVLDAPQTDYLYFVANSNFNGTHVFSNSYQEHMQNAHLYQQALNHADSLRKEKEQAR
ncbi:MAG TPA: endolytic transglycosylase MltG [Flavisolibacter sp.]|nr:endolytic transglycosylase MltG [Flavisolibacter sp.]